MAATTLWGKLSDELSIADANAFKGKAISLLRILNVSFEECLDIPGADFIVKSSQDKFIWVVQCQNFDISSELLEAHADQIYSVVKAFLEQGFTCDKYWVLHNHQHGNRTRKFSDFLKRVEELREISGISKSINEFLLLQRSEFLERVEKEFRSVLINLFQKHSDQFRLGIEDEILDLQEKLEFGKYYVPRVPAEEYEILFKEFNPLPSLNQIKSEACQEAASRVISERKDLRWTVMHGEAGAGKTTSVLHAATARNKIVLFIHCDVLDLYTLQSGTNFLFESIIRSQKILDEKFENEEDRELLYSLSGATLPKVIEHSDNHVLIFDGLDENRFYSNPKNKGLKKLIERLSDIYCPIVLVTRTAHFEESLFGELVVLSGKRGGSKARRKARALKLLQWTETQVIQLIDEILNDQEDNLSEESCQRIKKFKNLFTDDSYIAFYGDLPLNPLFLQFILSDVAERDIQKMNRCTLIYQWVRQKIYRDLQKENRSLLSEKFLSDNDQFDLIDRILHIMELTSKDMTLRCNDSMFDLEEFTESQKIEDIASNLLHVGEIKIIDLLLNSVLASHAILTRDKYRSTKNRITFSFRILQEYFLACFLVRNGEEFTQYPDSIKSFCKEIIETDSEEDLRMYLEKTLDITVSDSETAVKNKEIFISYTWGGQGEDLVNLLEKSFQSRGVAIIRDKRSLKYKGNIKEFMERLGRGKCIIVVICDKYLRSRSCMFELVQAFANGNFHDRIFPIIMDDAQIDNPVERIQYVKYWEEEIEKLKDAIKSVDPANLQGFREDIDLYNKIRATISELTNILRNTNALTSEMHSESNFSILFESIEGKLSE